MRRSTVCLVAMATGTMATLAGCSSGGAPQQSPPIVSDAVHPLAPGDAVRINYWREVDMNGEFPVDEAGFVVLPMLGRIEVAGRDPIALKRLLMDGFEAQLREPEIEITFLRRVSILGGVQTPGLYLLDPTMRLADAVALAGGASSTGDLKKTSILRDGQDVTESVSLSAPLVNQLESGDQIYIREKSWLERNGVVIAATLISAGAIIYSATIR